MEPAVYGRMRELEADHWWFEGRRRILTGLIADLAPPPDAAILEVGCGTGGNLAMLQAFGTVRAMEPDAAARAHATARGGVEVQAGYLPHDLPFAPASFDLVCAFDVIEHVDDDAGSVAALGQLVRPGGWIAATVPAYAWMWSAHDEAHHHKRRYHRRAFEALFRAAGLEVVKSSHFNAWLLPAAAGVRGLKRLLGLKGEDDAMPPAWLNRVLTGLFASERGWLRRGSLPFGLSIVVLARRPTGS